MFPRRYHIITYALITPALFPPWRSYDLTDWRWTQ